MGINEMGLAYDMNLIPTEKLHPHPERKTRTSWAIAQLMTEVSTVEEVLSKIFTFNWGDKM
jgi:penicillin V acylase-like amidase (Ntn superfamily)